MLLKMGEKIKTLRKEKNISQEVLAQYLGVTFQAVSKWENGIALPDVAMIPAIALFFGVSTDQLFDIHLLEIEQQVSEICDRAVKHRGSDPAKGEQILRDGLKKFPGNDILLNNLLYFLRAPERSDELIHLCKSLIEGARDDAIKYDACRILAETHKARGEYDLVNYYAGKGQNDRAGLQISICAGVIEAMQNDEAEAGRAQTFYEHYGRRILEQIQTCPGQIPCPSAW